MAGVRKWPRICAPCIINWLGKSPVDFQDHQCHIILNNSGSVELAHRAENHVDQLLRRVWAFCRTNSVNRTTKNCSSAAFVVSVIPSV